MPVPNRKVTAHFLSLEIGSEMVRARAHWPSRDSLISIKLVRDIDVNYSHRLIYLKVKLCHVEDYGIFEVRTDLEDEVVLGSVMLSRLCVSRGYYLEQERQ